VAAPLFPANINHPELGADDHRPQFPGENQRQYRQQLRHLAQSIQEEVAKK
jgi:hypothetical protein